MYRLRIILSLLLLGGVFLNAAFGQNDSQDLLVLVGQKVQVKQVRGVRFEATYDTVINGKDTLCKIATVKTSLPNFWAKYKVLKVLDGCYKADTIEFISFDHYGNPVFPNHDTILMFLTRRSDTFYLRRYDYIDLYPTKDNRLASPYSYLLYSARYDSITVKPQKIMFKNVVSFDLKGHDTKWISATYPKPYYKIEHGHAIAVYGNYVEDLSTLYQETGIRARQKPRD